MLNLSYTIRRGEHVICFCVRERGFLLMLDRPFINRNGYEYIWSLSSDDAKQFVNVVRFVKCGNEASLRTSTNSGYSNILIKMLPAAHDWVVFSVTHWGCTNHERRYEGFEPNLMWIMKLRGSELEQVAEAMTYYFNLEGKEKSNVAV